MILPLLRQYLTLNFTEAEIFEEGPHLFVDAQGEDVFVLMLNCLPKQSLLPHFMTVSLLSIHDPILSKFETSGNAGVVQSAVSNTMSAFLLYGYARTYYKYLRQRQHT